MSFATWLMDTELFDEMDLNEGTHQPHTEPLHSRPTLECLEERTLLDASSGLIGGASGNLNLNNNFNLASNGVILPMAPNVPNTTAVTPNVFPSAGGGTALAVSSTFLAQGQLSSQFRDFAINSQGAGFLFDLNTQAGMLTGAYGFGSGTQPNAPWKPNAYNLGLANHQANYSTQADNGFASMAPWAKQWSSPVAQSQRNNQNAIPEDDQLHYLQKDEQGIKKPDPAVAQRSWQDREESAQRRLDQDIRYKSEEQLARMEQESSVKPPIEKIEKADGTLPDTLWLSALAPAPMAALVAGLPGMPATAQGGAEGGEVVAAPE